MHIDVHYTVEHGFSKCSLLHIKIVNCLQCCTHAMYLYAGNQVYLHHYYNTSQRSVSVLLAQFPAFCLCITSTVPSVLSLYY